jgi:hypothetical protein
MISTAVQRTPEDAARCHRAAVNIAAGRRAHDNGDGSTLAARPARAKATRTDTPAEREARRLFASSERVYPSGSLARSAYHEAGHAVAAVLCGVALREVEITDGNRGTTDHHDTNAENTLKIAVSGGVSEATFYRRQRTEPNLCMSLSDIQNVSAGIKALDGSCGNVLYSQRYRDGIEWARGTLTEHHAAVSRVAYLLSEHRTISGRAVALAVHGRA